MPYICFLKFKPITLKLLIKHFNQLCPCTTYYIYFSFRTSYIFYFLLHCFSAKIVNLWNELTCISIALIERETYIIWYMLCIVWYAKQSTLGESSTVKAILWLPVVGKTFLGHSIVTKEVVFILQKGSVKQTYENSI